MLNRKPIASGIEKLMKKYTIPNTRFNPTKAMPQDHAQVLCALNFDDQIMPNMPMIIGNAIPLFPQVLMYEMSS
jgi:hypothetical protein